MKKDPQFWMILTVSNACLISSVSFLIIVMTGIRLKFWGERGAVVPAQNCFSTKILSKMVPKKLHLFL